MPRHALVAGRAANGRHPAGAQRTILAQAPRGEDEHRASIRRARPRIPLFLEVRDLRLVDAVARHESLTKAGLALHRTESALSHQLAVLERRVGASLFTRAGRRMVITPVCERLREAAHTILGELARVEEDVARARAGCEAVLRLSTECYTCYHWLPPVLKTFRQEFPTVEPRIVASATRRPVRRLLEGRLDVAIVDSEVHDRRLHVAPLFQDELVAVVAPEHPWSERPFVVAEDFRTEHVIGYLLTPGQSTLFREVLIPAGVKPKQVSRVQLTEAIIELVKAGMGVGALARWAVAPHLEAGTLRAVRVTKRGVHRLWSAVTFRERWEEPYVRGFVELLAREAFPTRTGRNHRHPR